MTNRVQIFCAISGIAGALLLLVGLLCAHFLPPTSPSLAATDIVNLYKAHTTGINLCAIATFFLLSTTLAMYSGLSDQMKSIQNPHAKSWASVQLALGAMSLVPIFGTGVAWALATYRLDRAPEITQALNDVGWFCLVDAGPAPALIQMFAVGFGTFRDDGANRVYPRWYSYFSFWVGILLTTGLVIPFFKAGPFAWNGILAFWLPAVVYPAWLNITGMLMIKAARRPDHASLAG